MAFLRKESPQGIAARNRHKESAQRIATRSITNHRQKVFVPALNILFDLSITRFNDGFPDLAHRYTRNNPVRGCDPDPAVLPFYGACGDTNPWACSGMDPDPADDPHFYAGL